MTIVIKKKAEIVISAFVFGDTAPMTQHLFCFWHYFMITVDFIISSLFFKLYFLHCKNADPCKLRVSITWSDIFKLETTEPTRFFSFQWCIVLFLPGHRMCSDRPLTFLTQHLQRKPPPKSDVLSVYQYKTVNVGAAGLCCVRQTACVITWEAAWHASVFVEVLCLFSFWMESCWLGMFSLPAGF